MRLCHLADDDQLKCKSIKNTVNNKFINLSRTLVGLVLDLHNHHLYFNFIIVPVLTKRQYFYTLIYRVVTKSLHLWLEK